MQWRNKLFILFVLLILGLSFVSSLSPSSKVICCNMIGEWDKYPSEWGYNKSCPQYNLTAESCKEIISSFNGDAKVWGWQERGEWSNILLFSIKWYGYAIFVLIVFYVVFFLRRRKKKRR